MGLIILEFTEDELAVIVDYMEDPRGSGSHMAQYLFDNKLVPVYESAYGKLYAAKDKEHPFAHLDPRVFATPEPWFMSEPWISVWLILMALFAGFKVADWLAAFGRWIL